jgi:hypothetical protein
MIQKPWMEVEDAVMIDKEGIEERENLCSSE